MSLDISHKLKLNDGQQMPQFGLGVYLSKEGEECTQAIHHALEHGYRLIDTASFYNNEASVGKAIKTSTTNRESLFVTSKLWNTDHGYDKTMKAFDDTMNRLGMDYLDLYLVHYPVEGIRKETWRAMEKISQDERCRSIGVSNYLESHLIELLDNCDVVPSVNQIELSPYCYNGRLATIELCQKANIKIQSYAPLTRGKMFQEAELLKLASKYQKTSAQVLLRWAIQKGFSTIPKSSNPSRIEENAAVYDFELKPEELKTLESVQEEFIVCWDPASTP